MRAKKEIIKLLGENKYDELNALMSDKRKLTTLLISSTYDKDDVIAWRAMEAIGLIAKEMSGTSPDFVRNLTGRLLWMMRDESGGICWSAPEILGEIIRNNPEQCEDIATVIASFHDEKMLAAGVLRAIGRIGKISDYFLDYAVPITISFLDDPDRELRGNAAWAYGELGATGAMNKLEKLKNDNSPVRFYEEGELMTKTVGEIAAGSSAKLGEVGLKKEAC